MEILQYPWLFTAARRYRRVSRIWALHRRQTLWVHVVRFSVGFGKPLLRWSDKYGTEFVLAAIPFGGYVQMYDDRDPVINAVDNNRYQGAYWLHWLITSVAHRNILGRPRCELSAAVVIYALLFMVGTLQFTPTFDGAKPIQR